MSPVFSFPAGEAAVVYVFLSGSGNSSCHLYFLVRRQGQKLSSCSPVLQQEKEKLSSVLFRRAAGVAAAICVLLSKSIAAVICVLLSGSRNSSCHLYSGRQAEFAFVICVLLSGDRNISCHLCPVGEQE